MSFVSPEYFWLLLFLLSAFIKKDLRALNVSSFAYIVSFVLLVVALCRPVIEQEPLSTQEMLSDVVIALDLSYSMQAKDIAPSRLAFGIESLKELVNSNAESRFGVLGFTSNAIVLSPLSSDSELLLHLFSRLDTSLIMTKGSAIMPALKLARAMSRSKTLSVVLLSDGADKVSYKEEAQYAKEHNLIINILLCATKMGSAIEIGEGELLKDKQGDIVISRENRAVALLSEATGGLYSKDIAEILLALHKQREAIYEADVTLVQNRELFYYFVALGVAFFLLGVTRLKSYLITIMLFFGISLEGDMLEYIWSDNYREFTRGVALYNEGKYEEAIVSFEAVHSSEAKIKSTLYYNIANSYQRLKEFEKAGEAYKKSLTLYYSIEADENLEFIQGVQEQKKLQIEQKKGKKSATSSGQKESKQSKAAASSNMQVSAKSGSGAQERGKKSNTNSQINLNASRAKLSSKQYELINKRSIYEERPY